MTHATPIMLKEWFEEGLRQEATHLIVLMNNACRYVMPHEKIRAVLAEYDAPDVWQIFKMSKPKEYQCNAFALYNQPVRNI